MVLLSAEEKAGEEKTVTKTAWVNFNIVVWYRVKDEPKALARAGLRTERLFSHI